MIVRRMFPFLIGIFQLMLQCAAEHLSALTCNATHQPDGLYFYRLSRPCSSSSCSTGWELQNGTVLTVGPDFDRKLVQNLTASGVFLRDCQEYLHYTEECNEIFEEAHCRVNCSSLMNLSPIPPTVNSTMYCLFESMCLDPWKLDVVAVAVVVVVAAVVVSLYLRRRRRGSSYTPANDQIKGGEMEIVELASII